MTISLICKRCGHRWVYTGDKKPHPKYPPYVTCPNCHSGVKLIEKPKEAKE